MTASDDHALVNRLLDQNERLIDALTAAVSSPEAIIRALNPVYAPQTASEPQDPYAADYEAHSAPERPDLWADETIPIEQLQRHAGFVDATDFEEVVDGTPAAP